MIAGAVIARSAATPSSRGAQRRRHREERSHAVIARSAATWRSRTVNLAANDNEIATPFGLAMTGVE
ncbi:MAG: hypothetical protein U5K38_02390 [Woeseiaceae bacterium]|nr:hypothetical protein [Woeseiaceae bacterium]